MPLVREHEYLVIRNYLEVFYSFLWKKVPTGKRKQYDQNGDEMKYGRME